MKKETIQKINDNTFEFIENLGYELIEIKIERNIDLVFYIYKKGGMDLDSCEFISRKLDNFLENDLNIDERFNLVISSPDLSRNLTTENDLKRNIGEYLDIKLRKPINNEYNLVGKLDNFDKETITVLDRGSNKLQKIEKADIKKLNIHIEI